jgi:plasmid stabilization system protein ParE
MAEEQDDLTLVYMWAFKQGEKSAAKRIAELEAALREIAETPDHYTPHMVRTHARATLGERQDG